LPLYLFSRASGLLAIALDSYEEFGASRKRSLTSERIARSNKDSRFLLSILTTDTNSTTTMEISAVGERLFNEFLDSDEQLTPKKKAMLDIYLAQMTNYVSSLQQNMLISPTGSDHLGNGITL
jgi:hypothetical protein